MTSNIQAVSDVLIANGASALFGLMGNGNLDFIADMIDRCGIRYVSVRHESAAVAAADGYARAGGGIGLATVTHGPGFTNALTALVTARRAATPLVLITGSAMGYTQRSTQRLDHGKVAAALGVPVIAPAPDGDWAAAASEALRQASEGAVLLDLPAEAMRRPASTQPVPAAPHPVLPAPELAAVTRAAQWLTQAERLMIVAGRGAARSNLRERLIALGRRHGARFGTTLAAKGYFHGVAGDVGIIGGLAGPESVAACRDCDVALVVGASLNGYTTEHGTLLSSSRVIRLDINPQAPATIGIALSLPGDPASTLRAIEALCGPAVSELAPWEIGSFQPNPAKSVEWPTPIFELLDRLVPGERTVVFDHGDHATAALSHFHANDPSQSIFMTDFGSLGLAVAAAIGAATAHPKRRTVAILGDGGLMMSLPEIDTLARSGTNVLAVVVNDGVYGAEYPHLIALGASLEPAAFSRSRPIQGVADALGIRSMSIREGDNLAAIDAFVLDAESPALLEIICAPPSSGSAA
ncbi:thiamine pyrophosphate-binding protein [Bosea sp. (in: a-proteobacteria)]|uniref:thiamine pyrophosphate-binding protein n=1 Tax=Bosea sp. (in: a-proteobacteria) TaxID=1871050 RepID=UPI00260F5563|nr:thiamine pyrophosphate-binding protein [Bosea sp. (in: a-proteobacteria)]MCO5090381.1 thiamine pyrophosphate-binding protein [Bosea sp. (in: a-proteobacteria)]